jgi:urease accessory protein
VSWRGRLDLHYRREGDGCVAHAAHNGPLRVLKALYPEGTSICHHVLVHPPGGIVGGDELAIEVDVGPGAHALITTPGATRFYRSAGPAARQVATLGVATGARLEWLPLEAIAYPGCRAENRVTLALAPGAETIGWDLLALGLPASDAPFDHGEFTQHLHWPGRWLEHGRLAGSDRRLLTSPLGLAGRSVAATAWFAAGDGCDAARGTALLDAARTTLDSVTGVLQAATAPAPGLVLVRLLAERVEPAFEALQALRAAWRRAAWDLPGAPLRIWRT